METGTDEELFAMLSAGDEKAFSVLYHKYWRLIYIHVKGILRDDDDAKDIVQDVFSSLWLKASEIPQNHNIRGYLYTSARHKVLNHIRHGKYREKYFLHLETYSNSTCWDTLNYLDERELSMMIEKEIAALPPRMRQVFELSRKAYLTHSEIGTQLGTSMETVKKQINKSLKILRRRILESGVISLCFFWNS